MKLFFIFKKAQTIRTLSTYNIEINPFESNQAVWIYELSNCKLKYFSTLKADNFYLKDSSFVVKNHALVTEWEDEADYILGYLYKDESYPLDDLQLVTEYIIRNGKLVTVKETKPGKDILFNLKQKAEQLLKSDDHHFLESDIKLFIEKINEHLD